MGISNIEMAQTTQEKFEFYVISLVFTLLALSIQTAEFGNSTFSNFFELSGWLCLLVSGFAGLWRMEFVPVEHGKLAKKTELENQIIALEELRRRGRTEVFVLQTATTEQIEERVQYDREALRIFDSVISKLDRHNMYKYTTHKYTFVIGVVCLVLSRGYVPAKKIIATVFPCVKTWVFNCI